MKKEYKKPVSDIYSIHTESAILLDFSKRKPGGGEENQFSKGGDWEDDDDLDGGSNIW